MPIDPLLVAKLTLTPALIGGISLAARRFGPRAGGALAGLPWTSSTLSIFLALEHGDAFARGAARGTESAVPAVIVFCFVYALLARSGWYVSLPVGILAFLASIFVAVRWWDPGIIAGFVVSLLALVLAVVTFPRSALKAGRPPPPPWDIPMRMVAATALVLLLTAFAKVLGPDWTGALSPFPVFASVLGVFIHRHDGPDAARGFLWGVLMGLISFATFFLVVGTMLTHYSLPITYSVAAVGAVGASFASWAIWFKVRPKPVLDAPQSGEMAVGK